MKTVEYTLEEAIRYSKRNDVETWVHEYLTNEGENIPFSEGLKKEERTFFGPQLMKLDLFERCCGPEFDLKYVIHQGRFEEDVKNIMARIEKGWSMPPLIINYCNQTFELSDGNHRFEAMMRLGIKESHIIVWTTGDEDRKDFEENYIQEL